ncbi:MAG: hypothetical protein ACI920_001938 [Saprospiraceae bacterium]|jgi:hypothetical protein
MFGILIFGCNSPENELANNKSKDVVQQQIENKLTETELRNGDLIFHTSRSN